MVDFGDAPVLPGGPGAHARGDRGDGRRGASRPARSRSSSAATTRSPSRTSRACAARHGPVGLVHFDTHADTGQGGVRRRGLARDADVPARRGGARRPGALRPDRAARLLARRGGVRVAGTSAASRASSCTTCAELGIERGRRAGRSTRVGAGPVFLSVDVDVLDPAFAPGDRHARAGRHDAGRPPLGLPRRSPRAVELVGRGRRRGLPERDRLRSTSPRSSRSGSSAS